jgi:hypothetical protein
MLVDLLERLLVLLLGWQLEHELVKMSVHQLVV